MCLTVQPSDHVEPMRWRRTFPGRPDQVSQVRTFATSLLPDFPDLDDVLFVLGEFVANALRHTKSGQEGGRIVVEVRRDGGGVRVSVADSGGPGEPAAMDAADLDESGRGLRTVSAVAESWGWHGNDQGRTVTATFAGR